MMDYMPGGLPRAEGLNVFCLQCTTGDEARIAQRIDGLFTDLTALSVTQEKHQSIQGKRSTVRSAMLPGYVFLYAPGEVAFRSILPLSGVYRLLSYGEQEDYALRGDDLDFARWVYRHQGLFTCSQAVKIGSAVKIVSGPLTDCSGTIERVDRHNRNVCLRIPFDGTSRMVWMPFQWVSDGQDMPFMRRDG
ncbi:MAG: hypothetical protein AB9880_00705 [Christensenellales bacterium]